jgi:hypothetical protein
MSNLTDGPTLSNREQDKPPYNEYNEKGTGAIEVVGLVDAGGVFEDVRPIDLDASGKERPIGSSTLDWLDPPG